jgi:rhodanese-related sulfurtransferase
MIGGMIPRIAWIAVAVLTLASVRAVAADKPLHKDVDVAEFEKLIKEPNTVVLDVRTPTEFAAGHLKDAVHLSITNKGFDDAIAKLDKTKTYLVYCASGTRSAKACGKLDALDFAKVYNLTGGIKAWEKEGKPVEK